jgi:ABC-2 type transport system ATP-binding protein
MRDTDDVALETNALGKRYGRKWALSDCTLTLPAGRMSALVGPNGAGKTTLIHLAMGLLQPSAGTVRVFGHDPWSEPLATLRRVGFVAQDHPLYRGFTVADTLEFGRHMNHDWDGESALARLRRLDIPLNQRVGKLSGGQQAQVALALALAKRPSLLLLDEPVASLDPLARRDFLRTLVQAARERGITTLLSSHIIADLEQTCDYLIILSASRVQLTSDITTITRAHRLVIGPGDDAGGLAIVRAGWRALDETYTPREVSVLALAEAGDAAALPPGWRAEDAPLENIVLAYLGQRPTDSAARPAAPRTEREMEATR